MKCSLFVPLIAVVMACINHARAVEVASPDVRTMEVDSRTTLDAALAPGGGYCVRLELVE